MLVHIAATDEGVSAKHLADALGFPIATTHHLLNTLQAERMVSKDSDRRYHLGSMVGALADAFQRRPGPPEWLLGPLRALAASTGETAYLSGWHHDEATVLATVEGSHAVRVHGLHTGFAGSAHARASGKVFLAFSDRDERERYVVEPPTRSPHTQHDHVGACPRALSSHGSSTGATRSISRSSPSACDAYRLRL